MKIFYVVRHSGIHSGSSKQLFYIATEMARRGHCVTVAFSDSRRRGCDFASLKAFDGTGVAVTTFDLDRFYNLFALYKLRYFLKENRFDVIHTFKGGAMNMVFLASLGITIPRLIHFRGVSFPLELWSALKFRSRRIHHVIAIADVIKQQLVGINKIPATKVSVIHGAEDPQQYHPEVDGKGMRSRVGLPAFGQGKVVALFANFGTWKGHRTLFASAAYFLDKHPNTVIWCVGRGDTTVFHSQLQALGIADRIFFTPFITRFEEAIAAADISICASHQGEGITGVVVCSMAMLKPVVTTAVGGNAEIITDGETGRVVPIGDHVAMGHAIDGLLSEPETAEKLARNARVYFLEHLQVSKMADKVARVYGKGFADAIE